MLIFPSPKNQKLVYNSDGKPSNLYLQLSKSLQMEVIKQGCDFSFIESVSGTGKPAYIIDKKNESLSSEEYKLTIKQNVEIEYKTLAGFYYAMDTLRQILLHRGWYHGEIHDKPAMEIRGVLIDIARNKIPTLDTLYEYIDFFAQLRYNHLEFYMEGYDYNYEKYQYLFSDSTPITKDEFRALSVYARQKFIDLVPNQNCLGHMEQWLSKPQLKDLAECPKGFLHQNLYWRAPMTLNVKDEKSFELIEYFFSQLAVNSTSEYFNVNLDEPFELGKGKNKILAEEEGVEKLYFDYANRLNQLCKTYGKKMMMWGDVVFNHPNVLEKMPKDVLLLDWIYEGDADFESHCVKLNEVGCEWCLCPGTSSWASFAGRSDNMVKNINNAVHNTVKYHGKGVIITDWGDLGHWQYITISLPAFVCAGQSMWQGKDIDIDKARMYCNETVFKDANHKIFDLLYNLGNYYLLENAPLLNTTLSFALMSSKYHFSNKEEFDSEVKRLLSLCKNIAKENNIKVEIEGIHPNYEKINVLLDQTLIQLEETNLCIKERDTIFSEINCTVAFIRHGIILYKIMSQQSQENYTELMKHQYEDLCALLPKHYDAWMKRNRSGGFEKSSKHLLELLEFYCKEATIEDVLV